MFKKIIYEALRNLNVTNKLNISTDKDTLNFIISEYGHLKCKLNLIGADLDYYDLYNMKNRYCAVIQDGAEETVCSMNPFRDATVISRSYSNNLCQIHRFHPWAFSKVIILNSIEDIKPNFEIYNVFLGDGTIVKDFDQLKSCQEIIAISKETFYGRTESGKISQRYPIHMILHYFPTFLGVMG